MKHNLITTLKYVVFGVLCLFVVRNLLTSGAGPSVGSIAHDFDLPLVSSSGRVRLAELRGNPVVVEIFASWCGSCQRSAPDIAEAWQRHASSGVKFVGVSLDQNTDDAKATISKWRIPFEVALDDGSVARSYNVAVIPTLVLIDRTGKVRKVANGLPSSSEFDAWLSEL